MPPHGLALRSRHALALGLLQGPAELLPVSSSAHTILVPVLARWPYGELPATLRKSFEVALHGGTALALALAMRAELSAALGELDARQAAVVALACIPPAGAGVAFAGHIESRLSQPRAVVRGLVAGAVAMAIADTRPVTRAGNDLGPRDGVVLGLAQAAALAPGVSRSGATLAAARALGFARDDSQVICWHVGLPVIAGASAMRASAGLPTGAAASFAAGAGGAFASTLACARLLGWRAGRPLLPFVLYRLALAGLATRRLAHDAAVSGATAQSASSS